MKKNSIFLFLLMFFLLSQVWGETAEVSCYLENGNSLVCSIKTKPFKTGNILNSMELGHRTEIEYRIRVYENKSKFIGLFGDRLINEISVSYVATRDPFGDIFHITDSTGKKRVIKDQDTFFETFFSMDEVVVDMKKAGKGEYYAAGKIEMKIIKLMPPLNLLSHVIPGIIEKTDWISAGSFRIK